VVTQEYRDNRARFPWSELVKYAGTWVAFSADGRRVIASGETVEQLEERLASGCTPGQVVFERLAGAEEDSLLGAGEGNSIRFVLVMRNCC
jgi:hypothetical protein